MPITSALVLFAVIWFLTLFIVLPLRLQTQGDVGEIEPGTHAGSPENPQMKKRFMVTTVVAHEKAFHGDNRCRPGDLGSCCGNDHQRRDFSARH